ncbi:MAG: glycosyltransferase family 4 protein [Bacteriovoracaceae bacterium]|nr:glycosyltransferase family 4 protein [Bacteriovoracaceae bacterium]
MNLICYVHDFKKEVGHSRAMIEVLNNLPIKKLLVICLNHSPKNDLFPGPNAPKVEFITLPGDTIKPFILKSIWFQFLTYILKKRWTKEDDISISIGACTFNAQIVNIQFAHFLWEKKYFETGTFNLFKRIYKKVLFKYLILCEDILYSRKNLKFVFLSNFMKTEFVNRYKIPPSHLQVAYSSTNFEQFRPNFSLSKSERIKILKEYHPELKALKEDRPTVLFVGAFERKGLHLILDLIPDSCEFVIVGSGERNTFIKIPNKENYYHVTFTKNISLFYQALDNFIFPTIFEPFGLVILEAAAAGMNIYTSDTWVGASELLKNTLGVTFINPEKIRVKDLKDLNVLEEEKRKTFSDGRLLQFKNLTWADCANQWSKVINSLKPDDKEE